VRNCFVLGLGGLGIPFYPISSFNESTTIYSAFILLGLVMGKKKFAKFSILLESSFVGFFVQFFLQTNRRPLPHYEA